MLGKKFKANSTEKCRISGGMNEECHETHAQHANDGVAPAQAQSPLPKVQASVEAGIWGLPL